MSDEPSNPSTDPAGANRRSGRQTDVRADRPRPVPRSGRRATAARRDGSASAARDRRRGPTRPRRRSFFERHRGEILGLIAVAAVVFAGGLIFVQANSKLYACTTQTSPTAAATPLPNGSPGALGPGPARHGSRPHPCARAAALRRLPAGVGDPLRAARRSDHRPLLRTRRRDVAAGLDPQPGTRRPGHPVQLRQGGLRRRHPAGAPGPVPGTSRTARSAGFRRATSGRSSPGSRT